MTEFEAETRAECLAYYYIMGKLTADATTNADKKIREYARQLLEIAERKEKEIKRLLGKEKEEVKNEEITASAI